MGGQAMEKDSVWRGVRHQRSVDLIRRKYGCPHFGLALLAHAGPNVRINSVRARNGFLRRAEQFNRALRGDRIATSRLNDLCVRLVACGRRDAPLRAYPSP